MKHYWDSYRLLLTWQALRFRSQLPTLVLIQIALGVGIVYGMALLIPDIDRMSAMFLSTGAPTLSLLILGLGVVPQEVAQARVSGRHDYVSALPVPRLAPLAADVTWFLLLQLPGTIVTLIVAELRFDIGMRVGWTVVPAILFVALSGAAVGYAFAAVIQPQIVSTVIQFFNITILLFSPINFPADRLPSPLRMAHRVLPIEYMADVMRGSLTGHYEHTPIVAFAVVAGWCLAGLAVSYRVALRRV